MTKSFPYHSILFVALLFALFSCKKDEVYMVPDSIQPYIDDFIAEAAARGIDLTISDLIVLFEGDLEVDGVNAAGVCKTGGKNSPTIKIDTTSLNWTINLSAREQLIYHELGHCVLGRPHEDKRLPNGNYGSAMRTSGEQIYGPVYSNFKKDYYLDEMFDEDAASPDWSVGLSDYNDVPLSQKTLEFEELFNSSGGGWSEGESEFTKRTITAGVYKLLIKQDGSYYVGNDLDIDGNRDYELEINVKIPDGGFGGLLWGGGIVAGQLPSFNSYFVGQEVASIGTIYDGSESSYQYDDLITAGFNKMTVRKVGNDVLFYINETRVDNLQSMSISGTEFGIPFGGDANLMIEVGDIRLYYLDQ